MENHGGCDSPADSRGIHLGSRLSHTRRIETPDLAPASRSSRSSRWGNSANIAKSLTPAAEPELTVGGHGYCESVSKSEQGRKTVEYLIGVGRLESVALKGSADSADLILTRAKRRLTTASAGFDGAFVAAYDAYRMASESLLARQGLRATGGDGSHVTVEDAVSAQFSGDIESFAKPTYERFRRTRHTAQYFDPQAPEITTADASWAIKTARSAVDGARLISESGNLARFDPS